MKWINLCGATCIASLLPSGASADLIFDQTVDLTNPGILSDFTGFGQQIADNFVLQPGASTITDVHWWGHYFNGIHGGSPGIDDFTIRIFADISGSPEIDPLNEFAVGAVNRVDTGVDVGNILDVFAFSVDIAPMNLAANTTYWLSIVNDTTADDWFWSADFRPFSSFRFQDGKAWGVVEVDVGFQLTNDAVAIPEPATWALFAAGLAGLGLMNRRRKAG